MAFLPMSEEKIPPCKVCGKVWRRKDADKWVYANGIVACRKHHGVNRWYAEEMAKVLLKGDCDVDE